MKTQKYVILGAGITGLSAACFLKNEDFIILEKESTIGGYCRTIQEKDYVWDYAGHFFHFRKPENRAFFEELFRAGGFVEREKNTIIQYKGKHVDYPFQGNIHQLEKEEFIDCLYDLYMSTKTQMDDSTFKRMLYAKFGKSIAEKFLIPYNEKLYACDLDKLDTNAMGRFFPYATLDDVIQNFKRENFTSYNGSFIYPKAGAQVFIDYLAQNIDTQKIYLNTVVQSIDLNNKIIVTANETIKYEYLLSTIPLTHLLKLLGKHEEELECFSCNKVLVFNLGFDKAPENQDMHWIYYPGKEFCFYRVGFYNNILGQDKMSLYVEIGFDENAEIDVPKTKEQVLIDLKKAGIISDHRLVAQSEIIMDPAYVHISQESELRKKVIENELNSNGVFLAGRYGLWTYCSMEDCFEQAKHAVDMMIKKNNNEKEVLR